MYSQQANLTRGRQQMNIMSPALLAAIKQSEDSRARMEAYSKGRVDDRRVQVVAVEEDRRKGPRRWVEKRALMATNNVEKD